MKNWPKILTLCFICALTTFIFVACEKPVSATSIENDTQQQTNTKDETQLEIPEVPETPIPCQHEFSAWQIIKASTCTEHGIEERHCLNCDYKETRPIETLDDHNFTLENSTVTTPPTCCTEGERTYYCTVCGHEHTEIIPVNPDAHELDEEIVPSTCTQNGYRGQRCCHCHELIGEIENLELAEHDYDPNTHQCKICEQYQPPIQNLAGSIWYLKNSNNYELNNQTKWLIHFTTFDAQHNTGECYTFKYQVIGGTLTETEEKQGKLYPGETGVGEYILKKQDNIYYVEFTKDEFHRNDSNYIGLAYSEEKIDDQIYYLLKDNGKLFGENYKDCVLIFKGYGV